MRAAEDELVEADMVPDCVVTLSQTEAVKSAARR